jgi:hypothetical protein
MKQTVFIGKQSLSPTATSVTGKLVTLEGEAFYQIANYDRMRPFFMSVVSSSDHWLFISSTGALTAGRRNPDLALFPYTTDDKIHDSAEITGSKTILLVERPGKRHLWEPFSDRYRGMYRIQRNLYKNAWGNKLVFEENNQDLDLSFRYAWGTSDRFGFIRQAWLSNTSAGRVRIQLLDGIQNLMPCGVGSQFQIDKSTLLDAYKRSELVPGVGLALFRLSSIPIDRPEPAEALRTTTVWSTGLKDCRRLLSSVQLNRFRDGMAVEEETDVRGERGAYFLVTEVALRNGQRMDWLLAADVGRGPSEVTELRQLLRRPARLQKLVHEDIERSTIELRRIIARADGLQKTALPLSDLRHRNNVLFNVMRGGIFAEDYFVNPEDLLAFVRQANREVASRRTNFFRRLNRRVHYRSLVSLAAATKDAQLERLCREYLPLTFSRRHGDPSRPWNRFSIATRKPDGSWVLDYEGNWRDIFQNWEALAVAYPEYASGMICRFVSASTADGYNPYRITRDGIDWEVINPSDPWAHIGYWGDHQLIYLLKLLELLYHHESTTLREFLTREIFAYANVPYRIKPYESLLEDPKETVWFDAAAEQLVQQRVHIRGADGKLLWNDQGEVRLVNLTEKLLVSILAKLSNFIPDAGIWMNTQRPEWNDANNALVGHGVSMVTLCYLRRYLVFCLELFAALDQQSVGLSTEVAQFLRTMNRILEQHRPLLAQTINDRDRKQVLDDLGRAGSQYRKVIYSRGFSGRRVLIKGTRLLAFFQTTLDWVDHSIDANRRSDSLYHAYNLVSLDRGSEIPIRRLYEMLEGQVAVLCSGRLTPEQSVDLLRALRASAMYRADQHSYLLYPNRELPRFIDRNNIPPAEIRRSALLKRLLADGNRSLVERDLEGRFHFSGSLANDGEVKRVLQALSDSGYASLVKRESGRVLGLYERLFDHQSFTGRSGTFFAYEGLGSIYWHMVSKLLLAVQEICFRSAHTGASPAVLEKLVAAYYDIRAGIGDQKGPAVYGAFPMDPYSHTPAHTGARQPGLTGQVKEDILCRLGELGVFVREGRIVFEPLLLRRVEFLANPGTFQYFDFFGASHRLQLPSASLAFTYCQVPVIYRLGRDNGITVVSADGREGKMRDLTLDAAASRSIFTRAGIISRLIVNLRECPHKILGNSA